MGTAVNGEGCLVVSGLRAGQFKCYDGLGVFRGNREIFRR